MAAIKIVLLEEFSDHTDMSVGLYEYQNLQLHIINTFQFSLKHTLRALVRPDNISCKHDIT